MSWIAGILGLIGIWLVGNKNRFGFIIFILCSIFWIAFAIVDVPSRGGLLVVSIPALFLNISNFIKWSKEKKPNE